MAPDSPPPDGRLTSWKAIARFFDRDVRTVQRWEREEGLPVRRHLHHRKSTVYAEPQELRDWWNRERPSAGQEPSVAQPLPPLHPSPAQVLGPPSWSARRALVTVALVTGGLALAIAGWWQVSRAAEIPRSRVITIGGRPSGSSISPGPTGDFNGDGRDDIVLSSYDAGQAFIVLGGQRPADATLGALADVTLRVGRSHGLLAHEAGDFNGDGIDDLVITEYLNPSESFTANGPSYVMWGRRDWPKTLALPAAADVTMRVTWPTSASIGGCSYARGGDLNQDGLDDVLLGGVDYGTPDRRSAGGALVFFGRPDWPKVLEVTTDADVIIDGAETGEGLGARCTIADVDGDGAADLGLSAPEHTLWNLRGSRGRIYLFRGARAWPRRIDARTGFDLRIDGRQPNLRLAGLRAADVNGDGRADVIFAREPAFPRPPGDKFPFAGEMRVFFGGAHRGVVNDDAADVRIEGSRMDAMFGESLDTADLDTDGLADLIVSEPGTGTIYGLYGRREWPRRGRPADYGAVVLASGRRGIGWGPPAIWRLEHTAPLAVVFAPGPIAGVPADVVAWAIEPHQAVKLDVRPDYEPNVILPDWVCVARVFGFSKADGIDPATLRLAGAPPVQSLVEDYNGDGVPDVQATFDTSKMRIDSGVRRIWIHGRSRSGLPIAGQDSIVVPTAGPGRPHGAPVPAAKTQTPLL